MIYVILRYLSGSVAVAYCACGIALLDTLRDFDRCDEFSKLLRISHNERCIEQQLCAVEKITAMPLADYQKDTLHQRCSPKVWSMIVDRQCRDAIHNDASNIHMPYRFLPSTIKLAGVATELRLLLDVFVRRDTFNDPCCSATINRAVNQTPVRRDPDELDIDDEFYSLDAYSPSSLLSFYDMRVIYNAARALAAISVHAQISDETMSKIVQTLSRLIQSLLAVKSLTKSEKMIVILAAQIIANLLAKATNCVFDQIDINRTIEKLIEYIQTEQNWVPREKFVLQMMTRKIAFNVRALICDNAVNKRYDTHIYELYDEAYSDTDVIAVHGLNGSTFWSWHQGEMKEGKSACWPRAWLPKDVDKKLRILSVDFSPSGLIHVNNCSHHSSISAPISNLQKMLRQVDVGTRPLYWLTHSFGGVLTKRLLTLPNSDDLRDCTKSIVFIAVPHRGSPESGRFKRIESFLALGLRNDISVLRPESVILKELNDDFKMWYDICRWKVTNIAENELVIVPYLRVKLHFVPVHSAYPGFGALYVANKRHFAISKPNSRNDPLYDMILNALFVTSN